ncbi:hypothetical protein IF2G_06680 [Cordyceps javanica]|nr:hypothetical protein IF2G_06680 [Cordyceps javanica]
MSRAVCQGGTGAFLTGIQPSPRLAALTHILTGIAIAYPIVGGLAKYSPSTMSAVKTSKWKTGTEHCTNIPSFRCYVV